jgi:transposase
LCYCRYLFVHFYPRSTMEFFLDGHIKAFKEIGGVPRRCTCDNLSSVVTSRRPVVHTSEARSVASPDPQAR